MVGSAMEQSQGRNIQVVKSGILQAYIKTV